MREKLKEYVHLLFAGTVGKEDMEQEILQNTLDRFDDWVARGFSEEDAYRKAVSGIGDIDALLGKLIYFHVFLSSHYNTAIQRKKAVRTKSFKKRSINNIGT